MARRAPTVGLPTHTPAAATLRAPQIPAPCCPNRLCLLAAQRRCAKRLGGFRSKSPCRGNPVARCVLCHGLVSHKLLAICEYTCSPPRGHLAAGKDVCGPAVVESRLPRLPTGDTASPSQHNGPLKPHLILIKMISSQNYDMDFFLQRERTAP